MEATLTRTGHDPGAATLTRLSGRVWTTRWTSTPGASLLIGRGAELTVVDHGMTMEATEALLAEVAVAAPELVLRRMVWLGRDHGASERTPEHAERGHAGRIAPATSGPSRVATHHAPLPGLPGVTMHAAGPERMLVRDEQDRIVLAGDLLAPVAPELWGLAPTHARQALEWIRACDPDQVVGSHGMLISGADVERAVAHRLAYLEALRQAATRAREAGATARSALHQALRSGLFDRWRVAPERHLVNLHAALAEVSGERPDPEAVAAGVRRLVAEREEFHR
ncbi:hypothetical protein [Nocardiopsis sp. MG754419]|uniref:hypothetical protein n=1 Tax=Nocardiopsis sp. MG754419 TaxID=2259865 RepID=UPI001BA5EA6F|nr:hypothetical protein [Nocardiopsis sp. MG754419]MBR8740909.1 hypothetical protein [Nocardiopsis sp. MG754419]